MAGKGASSLLTVYDSGRRNRGNEASWILNSE